MKEILSLFAGLREFVKLVLQTSPSKLIHTLGQKLVHRQEAKR